MAVIQCPNCKEKISNKAKQCPHCAIDLTSVDAEKVAQMNKLTKIEKQQKLMNQSFIAILLFCGGFLFMFWQNPEPGSVQQIASLTSTIVGFVWYIVNRARILLIKRK